MRFYVEQRGPHRDVRLVDIVFSTAFGDEQHAVEQEERPLVFSSMDLEGSLQNQFSIRGEVRPFPVQQQRLNLLNDTHTGQRDVSLASS